MNSIRYKAVVFMQYLVESVGKDPLDCLVTEQVPVWVNH